MKKSITFILLFLLTVATPVSGNEDFAGTVNNVKGIVFVVRQGADLPLEKGMRLYSADLLKTGQNGSTGIILQDNTMFSLGPDSELALKEFVFVPDEGRFSLLAKMIKGTFVYISGVIGKLSPESVGIETPVGVIAIRGTRFAAKIAGN